MARPSVKNERRAQILDGLYEAMAKAGTRGTSITEIAKAAGIARGALHYYFDSKEEIRIRLMERLGARYIEGLSAVLDAKDDKIDALARFHFGGDAGEAAQLLTVWIDYWGQAPSDAEVNAVVFNVQKEARAVCRRALDAHFLAQGIEHSEDVRRIRAAAMLALIEGALLQWRVSARTDAPIERADLRAEIGTGLAAIANAPAPDLEKSRAAAAVAAAKGATTQSAA